MTAYNHSVRGGIVYLRAAGRGGQGGERGTGQLSVPAHMNRALPERSAFAAEWHADGILYRYLGTAEDVDAFNGLPPFLGGDTP